MDNRVFSTRSSFRSAAYRAQRILAWLGVLGAAGCALTAFLGLLPVWTVPLAASSLLASVIWGLIWRRRVERAFWQGARIPRRGSPVRLPLQE